jgi:hypothetical protein
MFDGLMFDRRLATLLLSSAFALVGCVGSDGADDVAPASAVLAHETEGAVPDHDHPATPIDGGVKVVAAPPGCAPNTFDAIQAQIFDAPAYGCTQAGCHGASNAGLDLRADASYAGLLGLPPPGQEAEPHGHDDSAEHEEEAAPHGHEEEAAPHGHDEAAPHGHEDEDHGHDEASAGGHTHAHLVPGNPEASVLYDRLRAGVQGSQPVMGGLAMPLGKAAISRDLLGAVGLWIRAGAPQTGFVEGTDKALCKRALDAGTAP